MIIKQSSLTGVSIIQSELHGDERGWFMESYSVRQLHEAGIDSYFVQDNHSFSTYKGTLRGLHFQIPPKAQAKLVRCIRGAILDAAVDLRQGSPTYLHHILIELSAVNKLQLFIPRGFAHGFLTLEDNVEVLYKADEFYSPSHDRSIRYDDPAIGLEWPTDCPILSVKDGNAPTLAECDVPFHYYDGDRLI